MVKSKSWTDTMKEEVGFSLPVSASKQVGKRQTRAALEKKASRRQKAARWTHGSGTEILRQKIATHLERLECTNYSDVLGAQDEEEDNSGDNFSLSDVSEEDDDFDDDDDNNDESYGNRNARKRKKKTRTKNSGGKNKRKSRNTKTKGKKRAKKDNQSKGKKQTLKKRKIRPLGEMLLDDNAARLSKVKSLIVEKNVNEDTDVQEKLAAMKTALKLLNAPDYINATALPSSYPSRAFCVISGAIAKYKDPESGLPYSSIKSYRTLKEQPPPWIRASINCPHSEALKIITDERDTLKCRIFKGIDLIKQKQS
mmetsp:Transcript_5369/g.6780  ORF Transcript_5369/g.6780 Transcript_5369/m.6780 type:complete len:311 (-) Transcript_5369:221-1153(-)|eukprot:CAMPEP_0204832736 /NCGR_PEP_ID=MMETSP1346-20131115/14539_1 /ASSEMBLY_ACC=CAM_ASM_000771 /TAXON_ID=215587 /ORGANISM="Aplanochytrium stocchinoi, Strain GSBS06" /LENGTH=310 /DNA_ID=CAMNT_0051964727 /DNA_START=165 /DNA_END=1097 /DNA_ORIENTATION=-